MENEIIEDIGLEAIASEPEEIVEHDNDEHQSASNVDSDVERQAEEDGWVPKDKYRGDPEKWVSAEEFVERGKHINRILQAKLKRQEKEMEELRNGVNEFKKFSQAQIERKEKDLQGALTELKAAKAEAIRNGDGDAVNSIDDQIDVTRDQLKEVKASTKPEAAPADPEAAADFEKWKSRNSWYGSNIDATKAADDIASKLRRHGENRTGVAFLRLVDEMVREDRPELFTNQNRNRPNAVAGASAGKVSQESIESFKRSLPRGEYDMMELGIKEGWWKDATEFMNQYKSL